MLQYLCDSAIRKMFILFQNEQNQTRGEFTSILPVPHPFRYTPFNLFITSKLKIKRRQSSNTNLSPKITVVYACRTTAGITRKLKCVLRTKNPKSPFGVIFLRNDRISSESPRKEQNHRNTLTYIFLSHNTKF